MSTVQAVSSTLNHHPLKKQQLVLNGKFLKKNSALKTLVFLICIIYELLQ